MYTNLSNTCVHEHTTPKHTLTHICIHILGTNAHAHLLLVSGLGMRGVMNSSPVPQHSMLSEGNSLGISMSDWQASDIHFIECLTAVKICVLPMTHGFQNPVIDSTFEDLKAALFWRLSCASLASQAFFQVWVNHSGSWSWNISDCGQPHTLSPLLTRTSVSSRWPLWRWLSSVTTAFIFRDGPQRLVALRTYGPALASALPLVLSLPSASQ